MSVQPFGAVPPGASPDPAKPYLYIDGRWLLIASDDADDVPDKLTFGKTREASLREDYSPDEPRDDHGRWEGGGSPTTTSRGDAIAPPSEWQRGAGGAAQFEPSPYQYAQAQSYLESRAFTGGRLNVAQAEALDTYTDGGYYDVNHELRGAGFQADMLNKDQVASTIKGMDSAIEESRTTEDMTVFRGVRAEAAIPPEGSTLVDHGFVSTSMLDVVGAGFGYDSRAGGGSTATVAEIHVPAGSNALPVIQSDSGATVAGATEAEVVLPRDSTFSVGSSRTETNFSGTAITYVSLTYTGTAK